MTMHSTIAASSSHGGILLPLDMFRITALAAVLADGLVSRARNIVDAIVRITRHPRSQLVLVRVHGNVVGQDPAEFWREHADLVLLASQAMPRQCFLYYARGGSDRREGFVVAQRGQVLAADEATKDTMPPNAKPNEWPVARLCEQMRIDVADLMDEFPGGPAVELSLIEPRGDDQALLLALAGQAEATTPSASTRGGNAASSPTTDGKPRSPSPAAGRATNLQTIVDEDTKRRATEQAREVTEMRARAHAVALSLAVTMDELGAVVAPNATLLEPELLTPFVVSELRGDLPPGLPASLAERLQGKRIDVAVRVEFLSEVLVDNRPLSRTILDQTGQRTTIGDKPAVLLEVLAPRLGYGTLVRLDTATIFVSRRLGMPLPAAFLHEQLLA